MRKPWIILAIVVGVSVLALQYLIYPPEFPSPPEPCDSSAIGSRDYSIYRTLLEEITSQPRLMDGATILIPETTKVSDIYLSREDFWVERLPTEILGSGHNVMLSKDAVANFHRLSPEIVPLDRGQFAELPLVISDREEVDDIFENKGGWGALGASTIVHFSRIGFSCGGNQALVYRSRSCGRLCGTGDLVVLEKNGNKWQVVLTRLLWIS